MRILALPMWGHHSRHAGYATRGDSIASGLYGQHPWGVEEMREGAPPLAAINLVLSWHAEAVYNLRLRVSAVRICTDIPDTESSPATG